VERIGPCAFAVALSCDPRQAGADVNMPLTRGHFPDAARPGRRGRPDTVEGDDLSAMIRDGRETAIASRSTWAWRRSSRADFAREYRPSARAVTPTSAASTDRGSCSTTSRIRISWTPVAKPQCAALCRELDERLQARLKNMVTISVRPLLHRRLGLPDRPHGSVPYNTRRQRRRRRSGSQHPNRQSRSQEGNSGSTGTRSAKRSSW